MEAGDAALEALVGHAHPEDGAVALRWVADAESLADEVQPPGEAGRGVGSWAASRRGTLAAWLAATGRYTEAEALAERVLGDLGERPADGALGVSYADACHALGQVHAGWGRAAAARRALADSHDANRPIGHYAALGLDLFVALIAVALPYCTEDRS